MATDQCYLIIIDDCVDDVYVVAITEDISAENSRTKHGASLLYVHYPKISLKVHI